MQPQVTHAQHVRPARLGVLLALLALLEACAGVVMNLANGPIVATLLLTLIMMLFTILASAFWQLRFVVRPAEVELGWGWPFERRIAISAIQAARVEPYRALAFGGWGWRLGKGGAWAYSDIGIKQAVVLELASGKLVYVTLPEAEAAALAVAAALAAQRPTTQ